MSTLKEILPFLAPVIILQVCLQVYSIINLVKRHKVRFNNKLLWGIVILVPGIFGPVLYHVFRGEAE